MDVFVYGTLADRERATQVLDSVSYVGRATLTGLHRVDGDYPTLAPGGSVDGRVLRTDEIARLDAYEGVDRGLYARLSVPVTDSGGILDDLDSAAVYVGDPDRLDAPVGWPNDDPFPDCVRSYLDAHDVSLGSPA